MKKSGRQFISLLTAAVMAVSLAGGTGLTGFAEETGAAAAAEESGSTFSVSVVEDSQSWYNDNTGATTFYISTAGELEYLAELVNEGTDDFSGDTIILTDDIDLSDSGDFTGIGISSSSFAGTFDGGGCTVTLSIMGSNPGGLFSYVKGATIKNLTVDGSVTVTDSTSSGAAALAAYVGSGGVTIKNCVNRADITGVNYVGGLVGRAGSGSPVIITDCVNEGDITGTTQYVGGIAGFFYQGEIRNTDNYGTVEVMESTSSAKYVGGIAGYARSYSYSSIIEKCINYGDVTAAADYVGGIVGIAYAESSIYLVTIRNCGNEGDVTADKYGAANTGGIVGGVYRNTYTNIALESVYNAGDIRGETYVGGIISYLNGTVKGGMSNLYNLGSVYGTSEYVGGMIGYCQTTNTISNAYSTGAVAAGSGVTTVGILTGSTYVASSASATSYLVADNVYYLDSLSGSLNGSGDGYIQDSDGNVLDSDGLAAMAKDADGLKALAQIQEGESASVLGDAFEENTVDSYHSGYPVLSWEDVPEAGTESRSVNIDGLRHIIFDGDDATTAGEDYTAKLSAEEGYGLPAEITVTMDGKTVTGCYTWDAETGVLTIPSACIIGDIALIASAVSQTDNEDYRWYYENEDTSTYVIGTAAELAAVAELVNSGADDFSGDTITLEDDINISGDTGFQGIGNSGNYFRGTFDGAGHTVTLAMETDGNAAGGLFGYVDGAVILNVMTAGTVSVAGSAGAAGLVGCVADGSVTISGCVNEADVYGYSNAAGLAGNVLSTGDLTVTDCVNRGAIKGENQYIAGILGRIRAGTVENTYNYGNVACTGSSLLSRYVGGIAGYASSVSATGISITGCVNYGDISAPASSYVGGIAGGSTASSAKLCVVFQNCGNEGAVTVTESDADYTGGISGYCYGAYNSFESIYNAGTISGVEYVGGVIGFISGKLSSYITDVYNVGTVYGTTHAVGGFIGCSNVEKNGIQNGYTAGTATGASDATYVATLVGYAYGSVTTFMIDNVYYLTGLSTTLCGAGSLNKSGGGNSMLATSDWESFSSIVGTGTISKTADELKTYATAEEGETESVLGSAFKENTVESYHSGYPVLAWETILATWEADMDGLIHISAAEEDPTTVTQGNDYEATLTADEYYTLPETIRVISGDEVLTEGEGYAWDAESGSLIIYADYITGDITIAGEAERVTYGIDVTGLICISLSDEDAAAAAGEDYEAALMADEYYSLSDAITVTVGGKPLTVDEGYSYDPENGALTIYADYITGEIAIAGEAERIYYTVTANTSHITFEGEEETAAGAAYTAKFTPDKNYNLPEDITILMNNELLEDGYAWDAESGELEIEVGFVTGDVIIAAEGKLKTWSVTFSVGENISCTGNAKVNAGVDYEATLTADEYYSLPETITVTAGEELTAGEGYGWNAESGALIIYADYITGDITIAAEAIPYRTYVLGDVNGDGKVTVQDVTLLARYMTDVTIPYEVDLPAWDVDADSEVSVRDVTHLARYMAGVDEGLGIGETLRTEN